MIFKNYDAAIAITHIRHPGRWGAELSTRSKRVRIAGILDASPDALHTAALLNGLAALGQSPAPNKRVLVASDNRNFVAALRERKYNLLAMPNRLRATLSETLKGYEISAENTSKKLAVVLSNWLYNSVLDFASEFPVSVVSQVA